jgi:hypothetical protein
MKGLFLLAILVFSVAFSSVAFGADSTPARPAEAPVPTAEEEQKIEQHAPTIDVGDTRRFASSSPLSAAKDEEEWYQYY